MKKFIKYTFATLCGLLLYVLLQAGLLCAIVFIFLALGFSSTPEIQPHSVYEIKLEGQLVERYEADIFEEALCEALEIEKEQQMGLNDVLNNIRKAKENPNIDGIYLKGGSLSAGYASMKEIRDALKDFKESGKFVVAYADSYEQSNFYLASVADKVYLNDDGSLAWKGLATNVLFYTRLLEKLGVEIQVLKVGEFKSAVEPFLLTQMSDANRFQLKTLQNDMWQTIINEVTEFRGVTAEQADGLAEKNLLFETTQYIASSGMIDGVCYVEDMDELLANLTGTENYTIVSHTEMNELELSESIMITTDEIAVIYAEGEILDDGTEGIIGDDYVKIINKLAKNEDVKAVVLRVNSPGGSAYASEQIWHALSLLKKNKPLVVSMGDYAASGGYYISSIADMVYAQPTTITGSIGIYGLIPSFAQVADKIGIDFDAVGTHRLSNIEDEMVLNGLTDESRELVQAEIERGYERFVNRCATGRKMTTDEIKAIAEGRVWSGTTAMQIGLVDKLGTLNDAIACAAQMADIEEYTISDYPQNDENYEDIIYSLLSAKINTNCNLQTELIPISVLNYIQKLMLGDAKKYVIEARLPYQFIVE